jgi:cytochrome c oxidase assembly protein subunit 11
MSTLPQDQNRKNRVVAIAAASVFVGMVGLAYASVPLYKLFCQTTGYGGTTQRADAAPDQATAKSITIRFDANTSGALTWNFHPVVTTMAVKIGAQNMAYYEAKNTGTETVTGSAIFNVTPVAAGAYFNKIQCFCFTEQTLKPGQTAEFPIDFFVDPAILDNPDTKSISQITLSYTFYPVEHPKAVSTAGSPAAPVAN